MTESVVDYSEQPLAVEVDDVTMIFNMASEQAVKERSFLAMRNCQSRCTHQNKRKNIPQIKKLMKFLIFLIFQGHS